MTILIRNGVVSKYDIDMVWLLLLLFDDNFWKLSSLMQGLVKLFSNVTASSDENNINKEWGGKYDMAMVGSLLIMFYSTIFILLLFDSAFQE